MSTNPKRAKTNRRDEDRLLAQGIQQKQPNLAIVVAGTSYTGQQIVDTLTKRISLGDATDSAHGAWIGAASAERAYVKTTQAVINAVKRQLKTQYGQDATSLAAYGLTPNTPATPTVATKAQAVKKRAATKAAGGKKAEQKAAAAQAEVAVPAVPAANSQQAPTGSKQQ
ncbi:MAG TPA: hypothetical protein VMV18_13440 [bacterium]|nr:hypothetical protein [bacterium]